MKPKTTLISGPTYMIKVKTTYHARSWRPACTLFKTTQCSCLNALTEKLFFLINKTTSMFSWNLTTCESGTWSAGAYGPARGAVDGRQPSSRPSARPRSPCSSPPPRPEPQPADLPARPARRLPGLEGPHAHHQRPQRVARVSGKSRESGHVEGMRT